MEKKDVFCGQFTHGVPGQKDGNYFDNFFVQFVVEDGDKVLFDVWPRGLDAVNFQLYSVLGGSFTQQLFIRAMERQRRYAGAPKKTTSFQTKIKRIVTVLSIDNIFFLIS